MEEGWTESLTEETDRVAELLCGHRPVGGVIPFLADDMDRAITRDRSVMGRSRSGLVRTVPALHHGSTILDDCLERDNLFVHNGPEVPSDIDVDTLIEAIGRDIVRRHPGRAAAGSGRADTVFPRRVARVLGALVRYSGETSAALLQRDKGAALAHAVVRETIHWATAVDAGRATLWVPCAFPLASSDETPSEESGSRWGHVEPWTLDVPLRETLLNGGRSARQAVVSAAALHCARVFHLPTMEAADQLTPWISPALRRFCERRPLPRGSRKSAPSPFPPTPATLEWLRSRWNPGGGAVPAPVVPPLRPDAVPPLTDVYPRLAATATSRAAADRAVCWSHGFMPPARVAAVLRRGHIGSGRRGRKSRRERPGFRVAAALLCDLRGAARVVTMQQTRRRGWREFEFLVDTVAGYVHSGMWETCGFPRPPQPCDAESAVQRRLVQAHWEAGVRWLERDIALRTMLDLPGSNPPIVDCVLREVFALDEPPAKRPRTAVEGWGGDTVDDSS